MSRQNETKYKDEYKYPAVLNDYLCSIFSLYIVYIVYSAFNCRLTLTKLCNQLLTRVISPYIRTLKTHICPRYLARRVISRYNPVLFRRLFRVGAAHLFCMPLVFQLWASSRALTAGLPLEVM